MYKPVYTISIALILALILGCSGIGDQEDGNDVFYDPRDIIREDQNRHFVLDEL